VYSHNVISTSNFLPYVVLRPYAASTVANHIARTVMLFQNQRG